MTASLEMGRAGPGTRDAEKKTPLEAGAWLRGADGSFELNSSNHAHASGAEDDDDDDEEEDERIAPRDELAVLDLTC
ncbi:MAG: hypothetical protein JNM17_39530 [Archangium sp.]|nr:hypothetical protein [Archangium sp.]